VSGPRKRGLASSLREHRGRDLTSDELLALVTDLAACPELWRELAQPDPDQRTYAQFRRDEHVAVWVICWCDEQDTGFHDHDLSHGAVAVVEGALEEERLVLGGGTTSRRYEAGRAFAFSAADIHRVRHAGAEPSISLHAYSPPLWRMGAYEIAPSGELRRHSLSYAEELKPLN
jgi:predicted metal-dependent enzyme (double-stranded beta helix superfamily)